MAAANYGGEESENKIRYDWEDSMEIKNEIVSIEELKQSIYVIQGVLPSGDGFSYDVPNMTQLILHGEDGSKTPLAFSDSICHEFVQQEEQGVMIIKVYFKDYEVFSNPIPGVYISAADFPKELAR